MNKPIAVLSCLAVFAGLLHAATPSAASVKELMALTGEDQKAQSSELANYESTIDSLTKAIPLPSVISPDIREKSRLGQHETFASLQDSFPSQKLVELTVRSYQEFFTQEEIDGLIAFYKSPLSQAAVKKTAIVNQKLTAAMPQLMAPMLAPMMEKLNTQLEAEMKEMDKEREQFEREDAKFQAEMKEMDADLARAAEKRKQKQPEIDTKRTNLNFEFRSSANPSSADKP